MVTKTEITKKVKNTETDVIDSKKGLSELNKIVSEMFSLLAVKSKPVVSEDVKNESFLVNIEEGEEMGLLIGARGRTLLSLQTVLGLIFRQRTGVWKRIIVNVSDYRQKEEERLNQLAVQTAEKAVSTGEPQYLYNLNPTQRRIVHMALSEEKNVSTESEGEGSSRYLVVSPKK